MASFEKNTRFILEPGGPGEPQLSKGEPQLITAYCAGWVCRDVSTMNWHRKELLPGNHPKVCAGKARDSSQTLAAHDGCLPKCFLQCKVLCQVDDSSEEDEWDKEKETFEVYEARVSSPLLAEPIQSWPRSDFLKLSSQDH
jgi:hypothetical protein